MADAVLRSQRTDLFHGRVQAARRVRFLERQIALRERKRRRDGTFRADHVAERFTGRQTTPRLHQESSRVKRARPGEKANGPRNADNRGSGGPESSALEKLESPKNIRQ